MIRHGEIDGVAEQRRARRHHRGSATAESHRPAAARHDRRRVARQSDLRGAYDQRLAAVFVGETDADAAAAKADAAHLADGAVFEAALRRDRQVGRQHEAMVPDRLRTGRPGADPARAGAVAGGLREQAAGQERKHECDPDHRVSSCRVECEEADDPQTRARRVDWAPENHF
jgi:hypothetical protein